MSEEREEVGSDGLWESVDGGGVGGGHDDDG